MPQPHAEPPALSRRGRPGPSPGDGNASAYPSRVHAGTIFTRKSIGRRDSAQRSPSACRSIRSTPFWRTPTSRSIRKTWTGRSRRASTERLGGRPCAPLRQVIYRSAPLWVWRSRVSSPQHTAGDCAPSPAPVVAVRPSSSVCRCGANRSGSDHERRTRRRGGSTIITATAQMPKMKPRTVHSFFE